MIYTEIVPYSLKIKNYVMHRIPNIANKKKLEVELQYDDNSRKSKR